MLTVDNYDIALDLTRGDTEFGSITNVTFDVTNPGDTFIDLRAARVPEVILDGTDITEDALTLGEKGYDEDHGIALRGLEPGRHTLRVTADCVYQHSGQGLHRFTDPADGEVYLYTQFETADAKRVFACFDQPDLKATYDVKVTTPSGWKLITNAETQSTDHGETATHTARVDYRLSTYLAAFCVGPYHEVRDSWTGTLTHHPETPEDQPTDITVPFGLYCRKSLAEHLDSERIFTQTKQGFDYYHEHFGVAYPFHKYDQVFCPEYNMGAMENAGCITFRDEYVFSSKVSEYLVERRCDTILHELAHMWFGDLVTMQWWDDLWLNESFATWSAAMSQSEATEYTDAWTTFASVEKSWAYNQDQLPTTHPIFADAKDLRTVEQNFDGITYAKGASVLKQLAAYVGREAFFAGVRRHFANHAFGNATFDDLLAALTESSGRDLSDWANQWLKTTGINTLAADFQVEDGAYSSFAVTQTGAKPGDGELRDHRIAVGLYSLVDGRVSRTKRVELDVTGDRVEVPELIGEKEADLVLVNDDDLTYCLIDLDPASRDFVLKHIADIKDPLARAQCWSAIWEPTRDGKLRARDFVPFAAAGLVGEDQVAVLERVIGQAITALRNYVDPKWADSEGWGILTDGILRALDAAEPGSDVQLPLLQGLANTKTGAEDNAANEVFDKILRDEAPFEGVTVDADLRWKALIHEIASGRVGDGSEAAAEEAIREEQNRDSSASGQHSAWAADAAINTPEHKKAVYEGLTTNFSLSNLACRHKGVGLNHVGSSENLQQLSTRFYEVVEGIWQNAVGEVAMRTIPDVFPHWDITEEGLARADEFLAGDHPDALNRIISEQRDRVARALRNRKVDAEG